MKGQNFASQVLSRHTFRISRKKGSDFFGHKGTLSSTIIYTSELILCSTMCVPSATRHNIHMYPYLLFAAIHHLKSSPTFSVRPCNSVGRVTVDLIRRSWVIDSHRGQKRFFSLPRVVPCFPLLGLTPSG